MEQGSHFTEGGPQGHFPEAHSQNWVHFETLCPFPELSADPLPSGSFLFSPHPHFVFNLTGYSANQGQSHKWTERLQAGGGQTDS